MNKDLFGVKLVYKYEVHCEKPQVLYEEQILKVSADSFEEAYERAEQFIEEYIEEYQNINDDKVKISLYKEVDCFKCYEWEDNIQEVYSGFLKLDDSALKSITTTCDTDELKILRHK